MKTLALLAGLVFIALGIAGFAGAIAMAPVHAVVLAASGVLFAIFGISRRRALMPPRTTGNDMRDFV
jgi:membrane associated rhomboid family serine protease